MGLRLLCFLFFTFVEAGQVANDEFASVPKTQFQALFETIMIQQCPKPVPDSGDANEVNWRSLSGGVRIEMGFLSSLRIGIPRGSAVVDICPVQNNLQLSVLAPAIMILG